MICLPLLPPYPNKDVNAFNKVLESRVNAYRKCVLTERELMLWGTVVVVDMQPRPLMVDSRSFGAWKFVRGSVRHADSEIGTALVRAFRRLDQAVPAADKGDVAS